MKKFLADTVYRINNRLYYILRYLWVRKRMPNLDSPNNISEYMISEMLKPEFSRYSDYTDKIKVREYVKSLGLEDTLPQIYGIWDNVDSIDFENLPDSFVLKTNHGCGNHIFCRDKSNLNIENAKRQLKETLSKKYSPREPHYKHIEPCVYAEEFIEILPDNKLPIDYKIFCTKGKAVGILVCSERDSQTGTYKVCTYDTDWQPTDWLIKGTKKEIARPKQLETMLKVAEELSVKFDFVRVDLYEVNNKIIFGELTFTPHAGFLTYMSNDALKLLYAPLIEKTDK